MTPLDLHISQRPAMPRPFIPDSPAAIKWHHAFQVWVTRKDELEKAGIEPIKDADTRPKVVPSKGEYKKPAWGGSSSEYMAIKKREQRARDEKGCVDCGAIRLPRKIRCGPCNDLQQDLQESNKNKNKAARLALIHEAQAERRAAR